MQTVGRAAPKRPVILRAHGQAGPVGRLLPARELDVFTHEGDHHPVIPATTDIVETVLDLSEPNFGRLRSLMIDMKLTSVSFEAGPGGVTRPVFHLDDNAAQCDLRVADGKIAFDYPDPMVLEHFDASGGVIHRDQDWVILRRLLDGDAVSKLRADLAGAAEAPAKGERLRAFDRAIAEMSALVPTQPLSAPAPEEGVGVQEFFVTSSDGVELFVRVAGGGDPDAETAVILHGGPGCDPHYVLPMEAFASSKQRIVTFHQRGTGLSTRPLPELYGVRDGKAGYDNDLPQVKAAFDISRYVGDIRNVLNAIGGGDVTLVAHSWAGRQADELLATDPAHIARMIYLGAVPPTSGVYNNGVGDKNWNDLAAYLPDPADKRFAVIEPWAEGSANGLGALPFFFFSSHDPRIISDYYTSRVDDRGLASANLSSYDSTETLKALQIPATVIAGEGDKFGHAWFDARADALGQGPVVYVPWGGHNSWYENWPAFAAAFQAALVKKLG
jgi:pimeloyl-ACP methyl ester carboxylesterase